MEQRSNLVKDRDEVVALRKPEAEGADEPVTQEKSDVLGEIDKQADD